MVSEVFFVRALDFVPLSFPKLTKPQNLSRIVKLFVVSYYLLRLYVTINYFLVDAGEVVDIESFVTQLNAACMLISFVFDSWSILRSDYEENITVEELTTVFNSFDVSLKFNIFLLIILISSAGTVATGCYISRISRNLVIGLAMFTMSVVQLDQVAALKIMISERMVILINAFQSASFTEGMKLLEVTKELFKINGRIERLYSFRSGSSLLRQLFNFFQSSLAYWRVYGLKHDDRISIEYYHPLLAGGVRLYFLFIMLILSISCSKVTSSVSIFVCMASQYTNHYWMSSIARYGEKKCLFICVSVCC